MSLSQMLLTALFALFAGEALGDPASNVVEHLHEKLLVSMQSQGASATERAELLRDTVEASFDFATISRVVLGRTWGKLTEPERKDFIQVFSELSVATYAARFKAFSGESFVTLGSEAGRKPGEQMIRTELRRSDANKPPVSLQYLVKSEADGAPRIVNVVADGVSDLSLKRTEYAGVLEKEGLSGLRERLLAKIAEIYGATWQPTTR